MITLDPASGQGFLSILMGQFYGDGCLGLPIGIKQDPGLVASSRFNAKLVATKALVNFQCGYIDKEQVKNMEKPNTSAFTTSCSCIVTSATI